MAAGLHEKGDAFADKMKADDDAGRHLRIKSARATSEIFDGLEPDMQGAVVDFLDRAAKSNLLSPKSASGAGGIQDCISRPFAIFR